MAAVPTVQQYIIFNRGDHGRKRHVDEAPQAAAMLLGACGGHGTPAP